MNDNIPFDNTNTHTRQYSEWTDAELQLLYDNINAYPKSEYSSHRWFIEISKNLENKRIRDVKARIKYMDFIEEHPATPYSDFLLYYNTISHSSSRTSSNRSRSSSPDSTDNIQRTNSVGKPIDDNIQQRGNPMKSQPPISILCKSSKGIIADTSQPMTSVNQQTIKQGVLHQTTAPRIIYPAHSNPYPTQEYVKIEPSATVQQMNTNTNPTYLNDILKSPLQHPQLDSQIHQNELLLQKMMNNYFNGAGLDGNDIQQFHQHTTHVIELTNQLFNNLPSMVEFPCSIDEINCLIRTPNLIADHPFFNVQINFEQN